MKILIDLTALADHFSGIERFALFMTREMIRQEEHTFLLVFKGRVHEAFSDLPPHVETAVIPGGSKLLSAQLHLPLFLWKHRADRYFFPAFPAPFLLFSRRSVSAIHDVGCWDCPAGDKVWMNWYYRILYRKAALRGKKIVTVSRFSKGRIMERLGAKEENVAVVYNGISEELLTEQPDADRQAAVREKYGLPRRYILCLSTVEPRKNMRLLLEAYARLRSEGSTEADLVLAGRKGWLVDDLLEGLPAQVLEHIHFTGFVDNEDLPAVYRMAECFVFPSRYEGFGLPPLEAMACGVPVLSSDAASMPEVLGDACRYFINEDVDSLARELEAMLRLRQAERETMIRAGYERARRFDWQREAVGLLAVLTDEM